MLYDNEYWTYDDEAEILQVKRVEELHHNMFEDFNNAYGKFSNDIDYKVIIPDSVWLIDRACFQNMNAKEYVIPDSVEEIGSYAFADNSYLKVIQWSDSVKSISEHAFENCNGLKEIVLPEGIEEICDSAFNDCKFLKTISIPSTVSKIGSSAFGYCYLLKEISFSDSIRRIEPRAFEYCTHLESIQLPEGLQCIGKRAFYYCSSIETIFIPSTVEELGAYAFEDCKKLREIHVPGTLFREYREPNSYFKSKTSAEVIPYDEPVNLSANTIEEPEIITANNVEIAAASKREFKSFNGVIRTNLIANKKKK